MKKTLTIAVKLREKVAKSASGLALLVLALFAVFAIFPASIPGAAYQGKHLILASILAIYYFAQLFCQNRNYIFTAIDFWWGVLIVYTALSMLWGTTSSGSVDQAFHYLILYLIFKAFENISWEEIGTRKTFFIISLVAFILLILFQIIYILQNGLLGNQAVYDSSMLHFAPCLLSVIILPYVVFTKVNISNYLVVFLFILNIWTAYVLEMPQAIIVLLILVISYTLFKLTYIQSIKYSVLLGFLAVLGFSLYNTVSKVHNLETTTSLNPSEFRRAVYMNDIYQAVQQIGESPILGHGSGTLSTLSIHEQQSKSGFYYPNNAILAILVELGILGLIMFLYIGLFPIVRLFNERNKLSTLELAAVVSVTLFFFLSLFYGEMYTQPSYFATTPIIAIIGLAQISKKGNANTLISESSHKGASVVMLCLAIGCLVCYLR